MSNKVKGGWSFQEEIGYGLIHPELLLPKKEQDVLRRARALAHEEFMQTGDLGEIVSQDEAMRANRHVFCPYGCEMGPEIRTFGVSQTMIGYFSKDPNDDPNHFTMACLCKGCNRRFLKHWVPQSGQGWYVDQETRKVLAGASSCPACKE